MTTRISFNATFILYIYIHVRNVSKNGRMNVSVNARASIFYKNLYS